jgi:uroporphyrinogen-III synthase
MRLLVTRPIDDSEKLAVKLRALGHDPVIAPVMTVRYRDAPLELDGVQAILATSANGIRALARLRPRRDIEVFAVGPQTAETARDAGFATVASADGDAVALAETVAARLDPARGALFHAAGEETAGRLRQRLEARGFTIATQILYEAEPVTHLPATAKDALKSDLPDGVLVFSPRSAKILAVLIAEAGLAQHCTRLVAFCISVAAAEGLSPLAFARVAVAGAPNEDAMLELLKPPGQVASQGPSLL